MHATIVRETQTYKYSTVCIVPDTTVSSIGFETKKGQQITHLKITRASKKYAIDNSTRTKPCIKENE